MRYAKITDGSMEIIGYPGWLDSTGQPLTDDVYVRDYGIYPIVEEHSDDGYMEKGQDEWYIESTRVVVTYYTIVSAMPTTDRLDTVVIELSEDLWVYDEEHSIVSIQYEVRTRTEEEMTEIVETYPISNNNMDSDIYQVKPQSEWMFNDVYVEKTYYIIIQDPERLTHSTIFYDIYPTDRSGWVVNGDAIQEVCTFTPKTDMIAMKSKLNGYIADYRWQIEVGGYMFEGVSIATDRDSQSQILTKYMLIKDGSIVDDIYWKTDNGFIPFTPTKFSEMALAIESFVTEVYNIEQMFYISIQGSEYTTDTFDRLFEIYNQVSSGFDVVGSVYKLNGEV